MEKRGSTRREQIGRKQTIAELKNKQRAINRLNKANEPIPTELFDSILDLQNRLRRR